MKQIVFLFCITSLHFSFSVFASQSPTKKELQTLLLDIVKKNRGSYGKSAKDLERSISDGFSSEDLESPTDQKKSPVGLPPLHPHSIKKIKLKSPKTPPYKTSKSPHKKKEPATIMQKLLRINRLPLQQRKKAEKKLHDEEYAKFLKQEKELEELESNRIPCKKLLQSFSRSVWDYEKPRQKVKKKRQKKRSYKKLEQDDDDELLRSWIVLESPDQN